MSDKPEPTMLVVVGIENQVLKQIMLILTWILSDLVFHCPRKIDTYCIVHILLKQASYSSS